MRRVEGEIAQLEGERDAAMLARDVKELDRLLHDKLIYVHSSGVIDTKASYIAGLRDGVWDYRRIARSDQIIDIHETCALVFHRSSMSIAARGESRELNNRVLAVWIPFAGSWKLVALQSGALSIPPS